MSDLDQPPCLEPYWAAPATDFPEEQWLKLLRYLFNNRRPQVLGREVMGHAAMWLPYGIENDLVVAPYGEFTWSYAVILEQNRRWNYQEFASGRALGRELGGDSWQPRSSGASPRDRNPYPTMAFERRYAWDTGFTLGAAEREAGHKGRWSRT